MSRWINGTVIEIKHWNEKLYSIIIDAKIEPFIAGQFTKLGLEINNILIQRAYSYVNPPKSKYLEFYIVKIQNGKLTSKLQKLQKNDNILVNKKSLGQFTLNTIPTCTTLWMIATGTAIGPYISILKHNNELQRFKNIVLIHAVSFTKNLNYLPQMIELEKYYKGKLKIKTITSRETSSNSLTGRIPQLITNGTLEKAVNLNIHAKNSHIMLCGNPNMIHDTQKILKEQRNMQENLKNQPGHFTKENYW